MNLEPCPFCDHSEAEIERVGNGRQSNIVVCANCGCKLESNETFDHGSDWNNQPQRRRAQELEKFIRVLINNPDWSADYYMKNLGRAIVETT